MSSPTLRQLREDSGHSLQTIAAAVGIDPGHLSRVERGFASHPASRPMLHALAAALKKKPAEVLRAYVRTVNIAHRTRVVTFEKASRVLAASRLTTAEGERHGPKSKSSPRRARAARTSRPKRRTADTEAG